MNIKKLGAVALTALTVACGSMKNKENTQQTSEQVVHTLLTQERQKTILEDLKAKAIYDETTEVSYVFETMPTDEDTIGVAARNNIFFATPGVVNVMITDSDLKNLDIAGYAYKKVAEDVYQVQVQGDMQTAQKKLLAQPGVQAAVYEYMAYNIGCITYNDPQFTGYGQADVSADPWIAAGYPNTPTHAIDSLDVLKPMHTQSTIANPTVILGQVDGGAAISNTDLQGNAYYTYDFVNSTTGNSAVNHGTRVLSQMVAKANNSSGGLGLAHDAPYISLDTGGETSTVITQNYNAFDYINTEAAANPTKKYIYNLSISSGNDPILYAKLQQAANQQSQTQVFFVGAAGNSGATSVSYPAAWPEVIAVGAVNAEDPNKTLWTSSNTGSELDFVADGQNVWSMTAAGTFNLANGTSFSSPKVASVVYHLVTQDYANINRTKIYNRLKAGAKDFGVAGFDNLYGNGYARAASSAKAATVEHMPTTIDAGGNANYTFTFTPKFYNTASSFTPMQTLNRKMYYPNGTLVPSVTNPDGTVSFNPVFNTNNGFSNSNPAVNRLRYEFTPSNAPSCVTTIKTKPITITNLSTLAVDDFDLLKGSYYPNPVQDKLTIVNVAELGIQDARVTIGDIAGRDVYMSNLVSAGEGTATIDMSQLPSGTYFVRIHPKNSAIKPRPIKIIKQ